MSKFKSAILILGLLAVCLAASLATFLALSFTGAVITAPIELVFEVQSEVKSYDGKPLTPQKCVLSSGELAEGHTPEINFTGSQTEAGQSLGYAEVKIVDEDGFDVSKEYAIKVTPCFLVVEKSTVIIYLNGEEAVYSGNKVIFDDYILVAGVLAEGHRVGAAAAGNGVIFAGDVLTKDNAYPAIYDASGRNVSENYNLSFNMGEAKVVARPISVKPFGAEKVYDGSALTCSGYQITSGTLAEGHYAEVSYKTADNGVATITSAGELKAYADVTIRDANGEDVTSNYAINDSQYAVLKVTRRDLVVTAKSACWEYDGETHSLAQDEQPLSVTGLAAGEYVTVTYKDSITESGEMANTITQDDLYVSSDKENYNITCISGTLSVTPVKLNIKISDITKDYGEKITAQDVKYEGVPDSVNFISNASAVIAGFKEAGTYTYNVTEYSVTKKGEDASENYIINVSAGLLKIEQRNITLNVKENLTKEYDGKPYALKQDDLSANGLLDGHKILSFTSAQNAVNAGVGQICEITSVTIADEKGIDVTRNYAFKLPEASVTVTPKSVALNLKDSTAVFGEEPDFINYVYCEVELDGEKLSFKHEDINGTGEFEVTVSYSGEHQNYKFTDGTGTLTVTPKPVTVTIGNKENSERIYNGKALTVDELKELTFVACEELDGLQITDSNLVGKKDAGTYTDVTAAFSLEGTDLKNYQITVKGEFTILPLKISLKYGGATSKVYDGAPFKVDCSKITVSKASKNEISSEELSEELKDLKVVSIYYKDLIKVATKEDEDDKGNKIKVAAPQELRLSEPEFAILDKKVPASNFTLADDFVIDVLIGKKKIVLPEKSLTFPSGEDYEFYLDEVVKASYIETLKTRLVAGDTFEDDTVFELFCDDAGEYGNDIIFNIIKDKTVNILNQYGDDITDCYDFDFKDKVIGQLTLVQKPVTSGSN